MHKQHNWNREQCHTFIHKDCIQLYCKNCGKPTRFHKDHYLQFCDRKCCIEYLAQNKEVQKHREETNIKLYGFKNAMQNNDIKNKFRDNYFEKTGFINPSQNPNIKNKKKESYKQKTGYDNPGQNPEIRIKMDSHKDIIDNFGNTYDSKEEMKVGLLLIQKFGNDNIKHHYYSDLYPFECDFYIPKLDLYIEYQGIWHHGNKAFDINNKSDILLLESWKKKNSVQYRKAVKIWSQDDVLKRTIAKQNKLNYIEFFNIQEVLNWLSNQ